MSLTHCKPAGPLPPDIKCLFFKSDGIMSSAMPVVMVAPQEGELFPMIRWFDLDGGDGGDNDDDEVIWSWRWWWRWWWLRWHCWRPNIEGELLPMIGNFSTFHSLAVLHPRCGLSGTFQLVPRSSATLFLACHKVVRASWNHDSQVDDKIWREVQQPLH